MELKVHEGGALEIKKSCYLPKYVEEIAGWVESSSYFTVDEMERLWVLLPHTLEEMKAKTLTSKEKKVKDLERQLEEAKR